MTLHTCTPFLDSSHGVLKTYVVRAVAMSIESHQHVGCEDIEHGLRQLGLSPNTVICCYHCHLCLSLLFLHQSTYFLPVSRDDWWHSWLFSGLFLTECTDTMDSIRKPDSDHFRFRKCLGAEIHFQRTFSRICLSSCMCDAYGAQDWAVWWSSFLRMVDDDISLGWLLWGESWKWAFMASPWSPDLVFRVWRPT